MPKISIILPVYNTEVYLPECIESILAQTFSDFELLVINDGSADRSGDICEQFALKDSRIKVFHQENKGVSAARNLGLDNAAGEYIMFCDSDDIVMPEWCAELLNLAETTESEVMCGYYEIYDEYEKERLFSEVEDITVLYENMYIYSYTAGFSPFLVIRIFRKEIIEKNNIRFIEGRQLSEDALFVLEYYTFADHKKFSILNKPLYKYRFLKDSLTHKYKTDEFQKALLPYKERKRLIFNKENETDYTRFYTSYFYYFYGLVKTIFSNENKSSPLKKITQANTIIKSEEFSECMENADLSKESKKFINALRKKNYIYILMLNKLSSLKSKIVK